MKTTLLSLAVLALALLFFLAPAETESVTADPWLTSYEEALKTAQKEQKVILANFTGSDWCPFCKKLEGEVFASEAFKTWARENAVLLTVDFPKSLPQTQAVKTQNKGLQSKYGVTGYPTVLFLHDDGSEIGRSGYRPGGGAAWVKSAAAAIDANRAVVYRNLSEGLAAGNRPVLLVAADSSRAEAAALERELWRHPLIVRFSKETVIAVRLSLPLADKTAAARLNEWGLAPDEALQAVLLSADPARRVLLKQEIAAGSIHELVTALRPHLPRPSYDGEWLTDYEKAANIAAVSGKPLFLNFTGSDWCVFCQKLDKEVFSTDSFKEYARKNLVLVELDFPKNKELSEEVKQQNYRLAGKYAIQGTPTIILLNPEGKHTGTMQYMEGGAQVFLEALKKNL